MEEKLTFKGIASLIILIVLFSGIFGNASGPIKAFDLMTLVGDFGKIGNLDNFYGKGGKGAKDGFLFALTLIPTVMLALGIAAVCEHYGALNAARLLLTPFFRPLLGLPGVVGVAFSSSFMSSDVASAMTRQLYENNQITDDERTIFVAYQYAGSAPITNTFGTGGPLLPITVIPVGGIILLILVAKVIGANLVRLYLSLEKRRSASDERK